MDIEGRPLGIRPSLSCAIALHSGYRGGIGTGLQALARDISEGALSGSLAIVSQFDQRPDLAEILLRDGFAKHQTALSLFVLALMGIDSSEPPKSEGKTKGDAKTQSIEEFLSGLYRIGTGWLGWTPDVTLDATIAEIMEAHAGRIEMLKAVYGSGEEKPEDKGGPWDRNVRKIFGGHQIIKVSSEEAGA
ncbi:hypothetical protein A6U87_14685 [Rhizobium sp. AC44/96]|nr:hypothetical protein A6U87_14685 [Rhizobium sp. AC44/96]